MSRQQSLVSVVIPTLNANETLGAQLEALAGQTYDGETEVLVVDNGSAVSPSTIAASYEHRLRIRVLDGSGHPGASHARNVGIAAASGDIIAFCDADDVVEPDWLQALVTAAQGSTLVVGALRVNSPINRQVDCANRNDQLEQPVFCGRPFMWTCNGAAWRDALLDAGGFDLSLRACQDVDLSWRVLDAGGKITFAPDAQVHYRVRSTPRQLLSQWYRYGRGEAALYNRYADAGMERRSTSTVLRYFALVLTRWPRAFTPGGARNTWLMWAGGEAGRIVGSLRFRTLYL